MPLITGPLTRKSFDSADEVRPFVAHGHAQLINLDGTVMRGFFEKGWRWSVDVKPLAGTDSCQAAHLAYVVSGRLRVAMDSGEEAEFGPGDLMSCPPGHDAWVVGDETCVLVDWAGYGDYAKK